MRSAPSDLVQQVGAEKQICLLSLISLGFIANCSSLQILPPVNACESRNRVAEPPPICCAIRTLEAPPAFASAHPLPSALNFLIDDKSAPDHLAPPRVQTD